VSVVGLSGDDFWADVVNCATKCLPVSGGMDSPSEIRQFDSVLIKNEDVFWLEISVYDI